MKPIHLFIGLFFLANLQAQTAIEWQKTMGGNDHDWIYSSAVANDGYIMGGTTLSGASGDKTENSKGSTDFWIVKLGDGGRPQWQKTIGGSGEESFKVVITTSDGGFMLGGTSYSNISGDKTENSRGGADYWIIKLNSLGSIEWQRTIGGTQGDGLRSLVQTSDGGYFLGGVSSSSISGEKTENCREISGLTSGDYWVLKLNSTGAIEWQKTIGGNDVDELISVKQALDGGYVIGGNSVSNASFEKTENRRSVNRYSDYWILKLSSVGAIEWQRTLGGHEVDMLEDLIACQDGGVLVGGTSYSGISADKTEALKGTGDYWAIKLNSAGVTEWQKSIGGNASQSLYCLWQAPDGNYLLGGASHSNISGDKTENSRGGSDFWAVLLDSTGNIIGQKTLGGSENDGIEGIYPTPDGGYFLAGYSVSPISGEKNEGNRGGSDYWAVKLAPNSLSREELVLSTVKIFPNPTAQYATIAFASPFSGKITQTDILGKTIQQFEITDQNKVVVDIKGNEGAYFITVEVFKGAKKTFKILKNNY